MTLHDDQARPFATGQCLRCGMEAIGGICADCLADLREFIEGVDITGLSRWASAWPGSRGAEIAQDWVQLADRLIARPPAEIAPPAPAVSRRKARVQFLQEYSATCPGAPGAVRYWRKGEVSTMWQMSERHGQALDPAHDGWWTDFDIDFAYIAPAHVVEVLAVLEEHTEGGEVSRGHA